MTGGGGVGGFMRATGERATEASMEDRELRERSTRALSSGIVLGRDQEKRMLEFGLISVGYRRIAVDVVVGSQRRSRSRLDREKKNRGKEKCERGE
jgi:hypothetical protein